MPVTAFCGSPALENLVVWGPLRSLECKKCADFAVLVCAEAFAFEHKETMMNNFR